MFYVIRDRVRRVLIIQGIQKFLLACVCFLVVPMLSAQPLPVVASFSILADMVREVGGPYVEVTSLVGPNTDSHVFDPTPADAKRIASARLVFVNGLGFEGWLDRLVKASGYRGPIVIASKGVKTPLQLKDAHDHAGTAKGHGTKHSHGAPDPHAWQNLANAERYVETIRIALAAALPAHSAVFEQRAVDYIKRIRALDQAAKAQIAAVAVERRRVITSHDAFGYFAAAYGVTFYPLQGLATGSEPSAAEVVRVIDLIKKNKVSAIFTENISDPRVLERIAKDSGAKVGGRLYADALTEPGTLADTYLKMFQHNVTTIVQGISGKAIE
ncbi:MAG: metal ABC transporter substrate-binding protein [Alcaligenaceae bacterium]|nr:metal ABC transporter substrate-binding protein [Alcaligenaceae bacterium]